MKYRPYPKVDLPGRKWPSRSITQAPIWCSVDLRDGNQALAVPMNIEQKLRMFEALVQMGFKEIEVGFPAASQIEYDFIRLLVQENRIPKDVSLQVLVQAREHLIDRTIESLKGVPKAILHMYNSTSEQQRRITFNKSKDEIKKMALDGAAYVVSQLHKLSGTELRFEYSPESFTGTELDFSLEVCQGVMEIWEPEKRGKIILNLPATVELSTPNIYADMIEYFCLNLPLREQAIISLHTHNDRGTGIAATELGIMAGADRVEGTLFGNGERTGNLDLLTVALNLFTQGVDPKLDIHDVPGLMKMYEETTGMYVPPRHPYAGELVFTAFSGSHQDAINKGMSYMKTQKSKLWDVPYLPIDPHDIGRTYQAIIRINSQSGKGGVAYILEKEFGLQIPRSMQPELGALINKVSDDQIRELNAQEIYDVLEEHYLNVLTPLSVGSYDLHRDPKTKEVTFEGEILEDGNPRQVQAKGNGPIDAFTHGVKEAFNLDFTLENYHEQAVGHGSSTEAVAYIQIFNPQGTSFWGIGRDTDTTLAHFNALISAVNRLLFSSQK